VTQLPHPTSNDSGSTAGVVPADSGTILFSGPLGAVLLAGRERTGGAVSFVLHPIAPRALGSPVHTHTREDEWSFVLEGRVGIELDGHTSIAGPGDLVLKPRGIPHAFWNAGDEPARLLEVITPGGFESYFEEVAEVIAASPMPDLRRLGEVAAKHGVIVDPDSVPRLMQSHGLRG
jgi:quercetin dioxygenase-like cupin family protein